MPCPDRNLARFGTRTPFEDLATRLIQQRFTGFSGKTAEFCAEIHADMDWLLEAEADLNPYAKAASEELVMDYYKLCLKAVQQQLLVA